MVRWFPSLNRKHHWIEDGTATYVSQSRTMTGILISDRSERIRQDMLQGLRSRRPGMIIRTPGPDLWGGALFCLAADVEIGGTDNDRPAGCAARDQSRGRDDRSEMAAGGRASASDGDDTDRTL